MADMTTIKCSLCETPLTNEELRLVAEAEGMSVEELYKTFDELDEVLCDKCAEFQPGYWR